MIDYKKYYLTILLIACTLVLSSCSSGDGRMLIIDNSDLKADARMGQIIDAIKSQDKNA